MTIKIVLPEGDNGKVANGTKFYTSTGEEITGVLSCDISLKRDQLIVAKLEVMVGDIVNLERLEGEVTIIDPEQEE